MSRAFASYRAAIRWIADNDEPLEDEPVVVADMLTVALVADHRPLPQEDTVSSYGKQEYGRIEQERYQARLAEERRQEQRRLRRLLKSTRLTWEQIVKVLVRAGQLSA